MSLLSALDPYAGHRDPELFTELSGPVPGGTASPSCSAAIPSGTVGV
jgi:hypothetical protein